MQSISYEEYLREARKHLGAGRSADAEQIIRQLLANFPGDETGRDVLAIILYEQGDIDQAIAIWQELLTSCPRPRIHAAIAEALVKKADLARAAEHYRLALKDDETFGSALGLASVLFTLDRPVEAEEWARKALALNPKSIASHHCLAQVLSRLERLTEAEEVMRKALESAPNDLMVRRHLAQILRDNNQFEAAAICLKEIIAMEPGLREYSELGHSLHQLGRYDEALKAYEAGYRLEPHMSILLRLHGLLSDMGRFEEARELKRQILKKHPNSDLSTAYVPAPGIFDPRNLSEDARERMSPEARRKWYRCDSMHFFPMARYTLDDFDTAIERWILKDSALPRGILKKDARVMAFGSCFAMELRRALGSSGRLATHVSAPEGMNNTYALRGFLEWGFAGKSASMSAWYNNGDNGATLWVPPAEQAEYAEALADADCFVLTLGLAEVWRDKETRNVFWRGVPADVFDGDRHEFVVTTVEENYENLKAIYELTQKYSGKPVVLTLSPVPLHATFRDMSCIEADSVSKSILRVAIDKIMSEKLPNLYYWPSFEMVRWLGAHMSRTPYDGEDARHVGAWVPKAIIAAFLRVFFAEHRFSRRCWL